MPLGVLPVRPVPPYSVIQLLRPTTSLPLRTPFAVRASLEHRGHCQCASSRMSSPLQSAAAVLLTLVVIWWVAIRDAPGGSHSLTVMIWIQQQDLEHLRGALRALLTEVPPSAIQQLLLFDAATPAPAPSLFGARAARLEHVLGEFSQLPSVEPMYKPSWAAAMNTALELCTGDKMLLLTDSVEIGPGAIAAMEASLNPMVAHVAAKVLDVKGLMHHTGYSLEPHAMPPPNQWMSSQRNTLLPVATYRGAYSNDLRVRKLALAAAVGFECSMMLTGPFKSLGPEPASTAVSDTLAQVTITALHSIV